MNKRGVTLIELLIALAISAILVAGIYRIFISTQRSYVVQDQVVEIQQNVRGAINKMMKEIRMVNFGRIVSFEGGAFVSNLLPMSISGQLFSTVLTTNPNDITIIGGFEQIRRDNGDPIVIESASGNQITLNYATDKFDGDNNHFLSIGGEESFVVVSRNVRVLTLSGVPTNPVGHFIFKIRAVTYSLNGLQLRRDIHVDPPDPLADNIESLQFQYFNANGGQILTPNSANSVSSIQVTITARTKDPDPTYGSDGGFRRRQIVSTIQLRNMGRGMGVPQ
jgi:prepilin-type N-terminal cleavage/methylation domain-containing protein